MAVKHLRKGDLVPKPPEPRLEKEIIDGWNGELDKPVVSIYVVLHLLMSVLSIFLLQYPSGASCGRITA